MEKSFNILLRYFILILIAFIGVDIFYFLFFPLTTYPVYWLLDLFFNASLNLDTISIGLNRIEIVGACVAGSAYILLLILNLSTPNIKLKKRLEMLSIAFGSFLIVNVLRIFLLSLMYIDNSPFFDFTHKLFWYLGSTLLVVFIWLIEVKKYKISSIPFYSDLEYFYKKSSFKN